MGLSDLRQSAGQPRGLWMRFYLGELMRSARRFGGGCLPCLLARSSHTVSAVFTLHKPQIAMIF